MIYDEVVALLKKRGKWFISEREALYLKDNKIYKRAKIGSDILQSPQSVYEIYNNDRRLQIALLKMLEKEIFPIKK